MAYNIYKTFEASMVKTVKEIFTELSVDCLPIVSHQNAPEPRKDYVVNNPLRITPTGKADASNGILLFDNNQTTQYMVQQYEVVVQLSFFGAGAADNAMTYYSQYSGNTVVREIYTRNNLAVRRRTDFRRAPQLRDNVWVDSYAFDITLGFAVSTAQEIDWADYITVNGETIPLP